ncbi:penicillin-binding transpeptidase domain-containing protein [Flavobacterium aciduliphilum]|uniref:Penicillin binding protein n=1 Tax=Flavobacterium aciduliphilum TaxID=1101402 RepID=A0A328YUU5_9FLAO|nr:penicillin-binding transpeptidase domain-containing protein [Flavobacterium aciduliphilum]RAR73826.1 penicillin binding protein [Flavobacterium aciduliphilum]
MKKLFTLLIVLSFLGCKDKKQSTITPKLEKDLCESLYNDSKKIEGYTLKTYADSTIQNISKTSLLESLKESEADNGFVLVMETSTGKIKAMIGLEKDSQSKYVLSKNIAINTPIEPGSLMKTFDVMSLLEDKKSDTSSVYDAKGGKISMYGKSIIDNHLGFNELSLRKAFLNSSNTIFAKAIDSSYKNTPNQYINNFNKFGLSSSFSQISCNSVIPSPNTNSWSKITLPFMGIGYGIELTPIQLLTYFNSIANNGVMVAPLLVSNIQNNIGDSKEFSKPVSRNTECSKTTITILKDLLRQSVSKGSCQFVNSQKIAISGYSATTQINYSSENQKKEYASSFVGYFPSEKPKFTILAYIKNPNSEKGYYGSILAGSVVKNIAAQIY